MARRRIPYSTVETVAACIARGVSPERAANVAGVSRATVYSWLKNGDADFERALAEAHAARTRAPRTTETETA